MLKNRCTRMRTENRRQFVPNENITFEIRFGYQLIEYTMRIAVSDECVKKFPNTAEKGSIILIHIVLWHFNSLSSGVVLTTISLPLSLSLCFKFWSKYSAFLRCFDTSVKNSTMVELKNVNESNLYLALELSLALN